jgi:rubrerythrin
MNTNSRENHNRFGGKTDLATREIRTCTICGAKFSATASSGFCPMCMLRKALAGEIESAESSSEDTVKPKARTVRAAL